MSVKRRLYLSNFLMLVLPIVLMIAGISHDLRTPLTSIKAYLEGIEKGVAAKPQMQRG